MIDLEKTQVTAQNWRKIFQDLLIVYAGAAISLDNAKKRELYVIGKLEQEQKKMRLCAGQIMMLLDQVLIMEKASAVAVYKKKVQEIVEKNIVGPEHSELGSLLNTI